MIDFLLRRGIRLTRVSEWPDYYDELPGGSAPGRTVVAELFNVNELGAWKDKLRPSFIVAPLPATLEEMMELPAYKRSWRVKALMLKLIVRSEEHTSELQSLMRNSYAVFCFKKKKIQSNSTHKPSYQHSPSMKANNNSTKAKV